MGKRLSKDSWDEDKGNRYICWAFLFPLAQSSVSSHLLQDDAGSIPKQKTGASERPQPTFQRTEAGASLDPNLGWRAPFFVCVENIL
jgi:hypothetical protein